MTKTGFKIFSIIFLISIIIIIAILRSCRSADREGAKNQSIQTQNPRSDESLYARKSGDSTRFYLDSIKTLETYYRAQIARILIQRGNDSTRIYADSIKRLESLYQSQIESLKVSQNISRIADSTRLAENSANSLMVEKMLIEYDSLTKSLPQDLGLREREIARTQLCLQLAQKYNIAPDSLQKIMQERR